MAKVSVSTVSNVINNKSKCSLETKNKILEIMKELDYKPNQAARTLVNRRSNLIGILIPAEEKELTENSFYKKITSTIVKELSSKNYDLIISSNLKELEISKWIEKRDLDGLIILGSIKKEKEKEVENLKVPVVFIDNYKNEIENATFINSDDTLGGFEATEVLIEDRCKKIAFVGNNKMATHERRYLGYKTALIENLLNKPIKISSDDNFQISYGIIDSVIEGKIDGLLVASDIIAFDIINKLKENNLDILKKIKIISFGNNDFCNYLSPKLTSVDLNFDEKGKKAVEIITKDSREKDDLKNISIDLNIIKR